MNPIFAETLAAIDAATNGMTEEQLTFHPEGKWSTAEILEHLSLAFGGTARGFERARQHALDYVDRAQGALGALLPSPARDALCRLAEQVVDRRS